MVKFISFDLEYNKNREILSAGLVEFQDFELINLEELFFNNKSDEDSYKIHGLNNSFLSKYGNDLSKLNSFKNKLHSQDYLIGFDLKHDLKVLQFNNRKLFANNKIIDLKLILELFEVNLSLSKLISKTNLMNKYKSLFPIHTSIMDSLLTYIFFKKLLDIIVSVTKLPKEEIIKDLAIMSNTVYFHETWRYDLISEKYFFLRRIFHSIKNRPSNEIDKDIFKIFEIDGNIEVFNKDFFIIAKYKKEDFSIDNTIIEKTNFKKSLNIGFRDLV